MKDSELRTWAFDAGLCVDEMEWELRVGAEAVPLDVRVVYQWNSACWGERPGATIERVYASSGEDYYELPLHLLPLLVRRDLEEAIRVDAVSHHYDELYEKAREA